MLPGLVAAALLAGCSTYSDGSMDGHESVPQVHGPGGEVHPAAAHDHEVTGDGLSESLHGFSLDAVALERGSRLSFRVRGPSGAPQLQYSLDHGKLLHLYVVEDDLGELHHAHPVLDRSGSWEVDLPRLASGRQHVVVSFVAVDSDLTEHALVLGTDVDIEGSSAPPSRLPPPSSTATVDGYTVTLEGEPLLAQPAELTVAVTRRGRPAPLISHLESWAHVTAVHEDSLSLVHLHAEQVAGSGAQAPDRISLDLTAPAPGRYRFFVEFATPDGVHQVAFTRRVWG